MNINNYLCSLFRCTCILISYMDLVFWLRFVLLCTLGRLVICLFVLSIFALPVLRVCAVTCGDFTFTCAYLCLFTASVELLPSCISCLTSRLYSLWGLCPVFLKRLVFHFFIIVPCIFITFNIFSPTNAPFIKHIKC